MSELTLLTDEELVNSFQTVSIQAHSATSDRFVAKFHAIRNELIGRLIAARAENKRKDELLGKARPVVRRMSERDENGNAFITCEGHISASGYNDMTIEFINSDNSRRALIGVGYSGGSKENWYSLVGIHPSVAVGPVEITDWCEAIEIIEAHLIT